MSTFTQQTSMELDRLHDRYGMPGSFFWIPGLNIDLQRQINTEIENVRALLLDEPRVALGPTGTLACGSFTPGDDPAWFLESWDVALWNSYCKPWIIELEQRMQALAGLIRAVDPQGGSDGAEGLDSLNDAQTNMKDRAGEVAGGLPELLDNTPSWLKGVGSILLLLLLLEVFRTVRPRR